MKKSPRTVIKELFELGYWRFTKGFKNKLNNDHYKALFTYHFNLTENFYNNKSILDIGCGPRGSLEWANMAKERIGLDPLAQKYLKMGGRQHHMKYLQGYVENMPFANDSFDIISSFNSLDHVEDINKACAEIQRCLKPNGTFLLIVDVHQHPTLTEPQKLDWNFCNTYFSEYNITLEKRLQIVEKHKIYRNLRANIELPENSNEDGVLVARIEGKS